MVHQDLTKLTHDQLIALIQKERSQKNGPTLAWAKDKDGNEKVGEALNMTFPGKRSRYLEFTELEYIIEHGNDILERLVAMTEG